MASAPRPIVCAGNPVLRARAAEVPASDFGTRALEALVVEMVQAMRKAPGVGLAAPQLGVPLRVFVMEDGKHLMRALAPEGVAARRRVPFPLTAVVNPVLTPIERGGTEPSEVFLEGCLSVPGYVGLVARHLAVELRGFTPFGDPVALELKGWPARIAQHEYDHLEGTLYVDRVLTRSLSTNEEAKARWLSASTDDIRRGLGV